MVCFPSVGKEYASQEFSCCDCWLLHVCFIFYLSRPAHVGMFYGKIVYLVQHSNEFFQWQLAHSNMTFLPHLVLFASNVGAMRSILELLKQTIKHLVLPLHNSRVQQCK